MLDIDATRQNFNAWVRSPAFDAHFNSIAKAPVWPFIVAPLLILSLVGIPFGIGLLIYGHSIPNGNPPEPFAPGCPFTGVVLSPPWTGGEGFAPST